MATKIALYVLNPVTLDETKEVIQSEKGNTMNLEWKDDKENNRFMGVTPLFTDSFYLYAISYKKPEKGNIFLLIIVNTSAIEEEEEEEKEETTQQHDNQ